MSHIINRKQEDVVCVCTHGRTCVSDMLYVITYLALNTGLLLSFNVGSCQVQIGLEEFQGLSKCERQQWFQQGLAKAQ